jgi:O-antigen/teichoic acid export membrane protein
LNIQINNSSENSIKNNRLAKNTSLLYIRMMVVMIINLYTVRLVLNALGIEDYGIFNVIAGIITVLVSVSSVLQTATQRYYSYSIGKSRLEYLQTIFSASIYIYAILSIIIIILGETVGLWFVNTQLLIPDDRMYAANWIYQFSIFSFIATIMHIPYSAATIAHENMGYFALISTAESVLKLIAVILIAFISLDSLIVYGAGLFLISILVLISYIVIGHLKYAECRYKKITDKNLFKELLSFSGWSLFGSVAGVGMSQVNTILTNIYFGPLVNGARAISFQFNQAMSSFASSFIMAIRPSMTKSYAEESYLYLNNIFNLSNKFIYYCLLIIFLPLMFEMNIILSFWLGETDPQTVLFSRLILIYALIMSLNNPIGIIIQATGHVKEYNIKVEIFTLLCVPATFILFKLGYPAYTTFIVMIIAAVAAHIVRLICLKKYYEPFSYSEYINSFLIPAFFITVITSFFIFLIESSILNATVRIIAVIFSSILFVLVFVLLIGLSKIEKNLLKQQMIILKRKIGLL